MKIKVDYTHPYLYVQLYNPVQPIYMRNSEKEKQRRKVENSSTTSFAEHLKEANERTQSRIWT